MSSLLPAPITHTVTENLKVKSTKQSLVGGISFKTLVGKKCAFTTVLK